MINLTPVNYILLIITIWLVGFLTGLVVMYHKMLSNFEDFIEVMK